MKGVVFNLLEQVVVREYGENVWDDLLDATGCRAPTLRSAPIRTRR